MNDIAELIEESGLSLTQFSAEYDIPYRTVQDWHSGRRVPPPYVVSLLRRALKTKYSEKR